MKVSSYALGGLLTAWLAFAAVQLCDAAEQAQKAAAEASQTKKQPNARPKGASKDSPESSTKPPAKELPDEITLTKEFREAAMLAELAIKLLGSKTYELRSTWTRYQEEVKKAMTIADARSTNSADKRVYLLLLGLYGRLLRWNNGLSELELLEIVGKGGEGKSQEELNALQSKYLACQSHLEKTLSAAKYIGDGACVYP